MPKIGRLWAAVFFTKRRVNINHIGVRSNERFWAARCPDPGRIYARGTFLPVADEICFLGDAPSRDELVFQSLGAPFSRLYRGRPIPSPDGAAAGLFSDCNSQSRARDNIGIKVHRAY